LKKNNLFLLFLLSFNLIYSQDEVSGAQKYNTDESTFRIGFNIGPNYNSFRGNEAFENSDPGLNFLSGISFEYRITEKFSLVSNINYELKSFKNSYLVRDIFSQSGSSIATTTNNPGQLPVFQFPDVQVEEITRLHYINIPVLARLYLGSKNSFFVNAGFFYNSLLHAKTEREFSEELSSNIIFISPDRFFLDSDIGTSIGIGSNFKSGNTSRIFLELRYDSGLANIVENIDATYTNTFKFIANWSFDL
jgi:hypothetical protein